MVKYFLFLFNVIGLLFYSSVFESEPVGVSHNFPEFVKTGSEYVVELTINKNSIEGFAELRQKLPAGFTASPLESQKGIFSFSDNEVKFIWMSLPKQENFVIKYKLTVLSSAATEGMIEGTFTYLENNQKSVVNLSRKKVFLNTTQVNSNNENSSESIVSENENAEIQNEGDLPVNCKRSITAGTNPNEYIVKITLNNDSVDGFAKLEEQLPDGYNAKPLDLHNAVFSYVDQKVKFLWMSFPFEKEFTVSYSLTATESAVDSSMIAGFLSFTMDEESKKFILRPSRLSASLLAKTDNISNNTTDQEKNKNLADANLNKSNADTYNNSEDTETIASAALKNANKKPGDIENTAANSNINETNVASNKTSEGVSFRVQICATHKTVDENYFQKNMNVSDKVFAEMHEGWHKFSINTVSTYQEARDKREVMKQNTLLKGPFVVAYNNGSRISVQEALMVVNQKWIR